MTSEGNGFTVKEMLVQLMGDVRDHRKEVRQEFQTLRQEMEKDRTRIDILESAHDRQFWKGPALKYVLGVAAMVAGGVLTGWVLAA